MSSSHSVSSSDPKAPGHGRALPIIGLILGLAGSVIAREPAAWPGFESSPWFDEQICCRTVEPGVRMIINAPRSDRIDPMRRNQVIFFATPNGNSAEWTLGCKLRDGLDWHLDGQHIAAQTRTLRSISDSSSIVLVCVQADILSWPAWRQKHADNGPLIRRIVESTLDLIPLKDPRVTLTCHSGGGSFLFGYINGGETIPDRVERIVFLDANYGFSDEERHGDKLLAWLRADPSHRLINVAYDDRNIELNGKRVVGPTGGTFRASYRMIERLRKDIPLKEGSLKTAGGEFLTFSGMDGRVRLLIHPNPQNIILHTRLVGDMNGHLYSMALGTPAEDRWGAFGGPRAYNDRTQPEPYTFGKPAAPRADAIPARSPASPGGREWARSVSTLPPGERETAIVQQVLAGNLPPFLRKFQEIRVRCRDDEGAEHTAVFYAMPDYLAVGSDEDFVRIPMTPGSAQTVADRFGCTLPTRKMVNDIYAQARLKLEPRPMTVDRESVPTFIQHNDLIEQQRGDRPLGLLVGGIKKDLVLSNEVETLPGKVAIFGWHKVNGQPIQPLATVHARTYVDYSHGVRLIRRQIVVDGKAMDFADAAGDPKLHALLSDEGLLRFKRYPIH